MAIRNAFFLGVIYPINLEVGRRTRWMISNHLQAPLPERSRAGVCQRPGAIPIVQLTRDGRMRAVDLRNSRRPATAIFGLERQLASGHRTRRLVRTDALLALAGAQCRSIKVGHSTSFRFSDRRRLAIASDVVDQPLHL